MVGTSEQFLLNTKAQQKDILANNGNGREAAPTGLYLTKHLYITCLETWKKAQDEGVYYNIRTYRWTRPGLNFRSISNHFSFNSNIALRKIL